VRAKGNSAEDTSTPPACSLQAEKIEKAIQNIGETVKAVQKSACAEEKKAETTQNLKTSQKLLECTFESEKKKARIEK